MAGIDAYTTLMLHADGADDAAVFTDSSRSAHTVTAHGNAVTSSDQSKFGGTALLTVAITDYLEIPYSAEHYLGFVDWTIDFWAYCQGADSDWYVAGGNYDTTIPASAAGWVIEYCPNAGSSLGYISYSDYHPPNVDGGISFAFSSAPPAAAMPINTWFHVAIVCSSGVPSIYIDGVSYTVTIDAESNYESYTGASPVIIGKSDEYVEWQNGYIDEFRISKGVARWEANFTPPIVAYNDLEASILDSIVITEDTSIIAVRYLSIAETAYIRDSAIYKLVITLQDAFSLTDAATARLGILLLEYLHITSEPRVNWTGTKVVVSGMTLFDSTQYQLHLSLSDAFALADTTTADLCISILENLGFTELVTAIGRFGLSTTETLDTRDVISLSFSQVLSDALSMVDAVSIINLLLLAISDGLTLSDSPLGQLNSILPVTESLTLSETVASRGLLFNTIYDTLNLSLTVEVDGEVWECYVLNTPKFLPSIYTGFNFNSYAVFENRAYGCKDDGIYELTGDTDNGIAFHTGVQLSETKFGIPNQKRFRKAYVGVSGTTPMMVMETESGLQKAYTIDSDGEVDASRALRSKKWKLSVVDFETLDFIKLIPVVLSK